MILEYNEDDLKANKVVDTGWYLVSIDEAEDKASKDNKSINTWLRGKIIKEDDSGSTENAGVSTPFPWIINNKKEARWASVGLMNAAFGEEIKPGERRDTSALAGRKVVMFIGKDLYEGNMKNVTTNQYRAPKPEDR
jgi:hypothetical protein